MTTILAKRTNDTMEIVADKQSTGGYNLMQTLKTKLFQTEFEINGKDIPAIFGLAGDSVHPELVIEADLKCVGPFKSIYDAGMQLKESIMAHSGMKDTDIHLILATKDQCITISNAGTIEDMNGMIAIGSGFILAQGMHLANPDLDIQEYIPLISTKDEKTSSTFDYLKL